MTRKLLAATAALLSAPLLALAQAPVVMAAAVGTVQPLTFACQQVTCDGELWLPAARAHGKKPPVIVMAHGFGGLRDWGPGPLAQRLVKAGFAVVRFDYRGFGKSGGKPRRVLG